MGSKNAFVIMQVGEAESPERKRADEIYEFVIEPPLKSAGYTPIRSDLDVTPGSITARILAQLLDSDLVIADLTGRNPNVFYELGIVHAFGRPLISIADSAGSLPFDTKDERIIEVGSFPPEVGIPARRVASAKELLSRTLALVGEESYSPPSPLRETASLASLTPDDPVAMELSQLRDSVEEVRKAIQPKTYLPESYLEALKALRTFTERVVKEEPVEKAVRSLVAKNVGNKSHREWLQEIENKAFPWGIPQKNGWDDPSSNEPPF